MGFKIGDKARIRDNLVRGKAYCNENSTIALFVTDAVSKVVGNVVTISAVYENWYGVNEYQLLFCDGMLEPMKGQQSQKQKAKKIRTSDISKAHPKQDATVKVASVKSISFD